MPSRTSTVSSAVGKPAVTYVTSAVRFSAAHRAKVCLICSMVIGESNEESKVMGGGPKCVVVN